MDKDQALNYLYQMLLIRIFEERAAEMYTYGKIGGFLHLYIGEEAVAVGAVAALRDDDDLFVHYRDHGYALARGCDPGAVMAELFGKVTGLGGGKGGSMHLADVRRHLWGGYAIVGSQIALGVGMALARQYQHSDAVVLDVFGDGATNIGYYHEGMNLAALWHLPVIFLCENNLYGMGTPEEQASAEPELYKTAAAYSMPGERIDGMDLLAVKDAVSRAAERARAGNGPTLIEAVTYRYRGHSMADPEMYRSRDEVERRRPNDPIRRFGDKMEQEGVFTTSDAERVRMEAERVVDEAVRFAETSPEPPLEALYEDIFVKTEQDKRLW